MRTSFAGGVLTVRSEREGDRLPLSVIVKLAEEITYVLEIDEGRVKAAQSKMHEATMELADFVSKYQPRESLISRIISWAKEGW